MKKILLLLTVALSAGLQAQQIYCDHEGIKLARYGFYSGIIDTAHVNPLVDGINGSVLCAKYIRDTAMYDNIKLYPQNKLVDVTPYASNAISAPKITMKLYTNSPVGTTIRLQLGTKLAETYPAGIHSEYSAITSIQNAWQVLTFNYTGSPSGSIVGPYDIDKVVLLINPGTASRDTMYIDDLSGPALLSSGIERLEMSSAKLYQNTPNPAKERSSISFQIAATEAVSLKIHDITGNTVLTLVDEDLKPGNYTIPVETGTLPNGVYFYTLVAGNTKRSMKMVVSR